MIPVSNTLFRAMQNNTAFEEYLSIRFANGTTKTVPQADLMLADNSITAGAGGNTLPVGMAVGKILNIALANQSHQYSQYDFYGAEITLKIRYTLGNSYEELAAGKYTVLEPATKGTVLKVSAADAMYRADKEFASNYTYPRSAQNVLNDCCSACGIPIQSASIPNGSYSIQKKPENCTYREVIGWCAMIAGGNAVINRDGRLEIKTYNLTAAHNALTMDGGVYYPWLTAYQANGGSYNPWSNPATYEGGDFSWQGVDFHVLAQWLEEPTVGTDDITITGVGMRLENDEEIVNGTTAYAIYVENQLLAGDESDGLALIAAAIVGITIRPFSGKTIGNPTIEFMDPVVVATPRGESYASVVTDVEYSFRGGTTVGCSVEQKIENGLAYNYGTNTKQATKREIRRQLTSYDIGVQNLNDLMARSLGYYKTVQEQENGSVVSYIHDKPTLASSTVIYKMTADGYAQSVDGGQTWIAGVTAQGNAVMNTVAAKGISFDWANGGAITINKNGHEVFYADVDTGIVRMDADNITIGGSNYSEGDTISSVIGDIVSDYEQKIDGKIDTYYAASDPGASWTAAQKPSHYGDIWYNTTDTKTYIYQSNGWQLMKTQPPQAVFDEIDGKAQIFTGSSTPVGPYDVGDLWVLTNEKVKRCNTKNTSQTSNTEHWTPLGYTDDSALDAYKIEMDSTEAIFNRLTQNGTVKGIFLRPVTENGVTTKQLFISFNYAEGGTLKLGRGINNYGNLVVFGGKDSNNNELKIVEVNEDKVKIATEGKWSTEYIEIYENILRAYSGGSEKLAIDFTANYSGGVIKTVYTQKDAGFLWKSNVYEFWNQAESQRYLYITSSAFTVKSSSYYLYNSDATITLLDLSSTAMKVKANGFSVKDTSDNTLLSVYKNSSFISRGSSYTFYNGDATSTYLSMSSSYGFVADNSLYHFKRSTDANHHYLKMDSGGLTAYNSSYSFYNADGTRTLFSVSTGGMIIYGSSFTFKTTSSNTEYNMLSMGPSSTALYTNAYSVYKLDSSIKWISAADTLVEFRNKSKISLYQTNYGGTISIKTACGDVDVIPSYKQLQDSSGNNHISRYRNRMALVSFDTGPNENYESSTDTVGTEHYFDISANSVMISCYKDISGTTAYQTVKITRYNVAITGDVSVSSSVKVNGTTVHSSDVRLKKNITPMSGDSIIDRLKPVAFDWKRDKRHVSAGLIAQDVKEICPELVEDMGGGYLGVNYTGLVPHLVAKAQEQQRMIDNLYDRLMEAETLIMRLIDGRE